jgi:uncharacterized protein DUF6463
MTRKALTRWASGIMIGLGAGHLTLSVLLSRKELAGWVEHGLWAAVPLRPGDPSLEALRTQSVFWAGAGSFAVPLALLGGLAWHLAGRGVTVPAGFGWAVAAWCAVGGVLLVPSPYFLGVVAGALLIAAARPAAADLMPAEPAIAR